MASSNTVPEMRMLQSINDHLGELLTPACAMALNFHVDSKGALVDALRYEEDLQALFGAGSALIIRELRDGLCVEAGKSPKAGCNGIEGCLRCLEQKEWGKTFPNVPAMAPGPWEPIFIFPTPSLR